MLNNCTFQGRFAADPEMRTTQSGLTVASFRMAVDRDNVGQDGRQATDWLNFVAWRKTAEFVCQYFRKGSTALVECQELISDAERTANMPGYAGAVFNAISPALKAAMPAAQKKARRQIDVLTRAKERLMELMEEPQK